MRADAILFDKDGTLFDFQKSWGPWIADEIASAAPGNPALAAEIGEVLGFDPIAGRFLPHSPAIAGTTEDVAELLLPYTAEASVFELAERLNAQAARLTPVEVVPLVPFLSRLAAADLFLGVSTNDSEMGARSHLSVFGVTGMFDFIAGYDSGYGSKPAPGMCLGFARQCRVLPHRAVMVGDSLHDLHAGRAAGMQTVGVLTGVATAADLAPHADVVLPDIGHLVGWLAG